MSEIIRSRGQVAVIGLGVSGLASLHFLANQGYQVIALDDRPMRVDQLNQTGELPQGVKAQVFDEHLIQECERAVISPGLDPQDGKYSKFAGKLVSDIQLACEHAHHLGAAVVAITGSNAKSTVTTLVGDMLRSSGKHTRVGGNLGPAALTLFDCERKLDVLVLEVSSFQLQTTDFVHAKVACVLNLSADHLDRHKDMLGYHRAKHRIFEGAQSIVVNRDDPLTKPLVADELPKLSFGSTMPDLKQYGLYTENKSGHTHVWIGRGFERLVRSDELKIKGQHNLLNAQAALAIAELAGADLNLSIKALKDFKGLDHRCAFVDRVEACDFYNDSKGTNVGATLAAVEGLGLSYASPSEERSLTVILGGEAKDQDFSELLKPLDHYAKAVYIYGADQTKVAADLKALGNRIICTQTLAQVVQLMEKTGELTGATLFSPACASFDQFTNYIERGEQFIKLVTDLKRSRQGELDVDSSHHE